MKTRDPNERDESATPPELTPQQLRAIYDRLKKDVDPEQMEREYRELLDHPEQWLSFEEVVNALQAEFEDR